MSSRTLRTHLVAAAILLLSLGFNAAARADSPRVAGEAAWGTAKAAAPAAFKTLRAGVEEGAVPMREIAVPAVASDRIEQAKRNNLAAQRKATQVGIEQPLEQAEAVTRDLDWVSTAGGKAVMLRLSAAGALGLRVAFVGRFPASSELRVAGSDAPDRVQDVVSERELATLRDAEGRYWTTPTEGGAQILEIFVPEGADLAGADFRIVATSQLFATAANGFKEATQLKGLSGSCNVDAVCSSASLGTGYVNAKNAVAEMLFQGANGSGTFLCTGTLLNDNDPASQIPYFYSANHCIGTQSQANTLVTSWGYENTCNGPDVSLAQSTSLSGGGTLLYADTNTDVLLLRLNRPPPAAAFFAGWDSAALPNSVPVTIIHHPRGDPKKVTQGQLIDIKFDSQLSGSFWSPGYTSGTTEGGSSGSGLFTVSNGSYSLRGGLLGGPAACSNSGSLSNTSFTGNYDLYSRFDLAFSNLRKWLFDIATTPSDYSDMWWVGAAENGWGMSIQQHASSKLQFNVLYVYDNTGAPRWYVMPGGTWSNNYTTFSGPLYLPTGSPLNNFNTNAVQVGQPVGSATIDFGGASNAYLSYTINGISATKAIQRQAYAAGTAPFNVNDLWWGGPSQNGWGINIAQQAGTLFSVWYTYLPNGTATWYVMPGGSWNGTTYSGALYATTGSPWLGTTYNPGTLVVTNVGTMNLIFTDANNGSMSYSFVSGPYAGVNQTKPIVRQPY